MHATINWSSSKVLAGSGYNLPQNHGCHSTLQHTATAAEVAGRGLLYQVFCTKRSAMVVVRAYLWVYTIAFLPKLGVATNHDKIQELPLEECYHTFSNYRGTHNQPLSPPEGIDNPT
jgi:hypothetical protein